MKTIAKFAAASAFALTLAACGDSGDASEDAMADSVEMPADEAMAEVPDPAEDVTAAAEEATQTAEENLDAAEAAAAAAEETVADVEAAAAAAEAAE